MVYEILVGAGRSRVTDTLSYESAKKLMPGTVVLVPLRDETAFGIVVRASTASW